MTKTKEVNTELKDLLERARRCPMKQRMYVYAAFKQELLEMNLEPYEFDEACRKLARYLKV